MKIKFKQLLNFPIQFVNQDIALPYLKNLFTKGILFSGRSLLTK